MFPLALGVVTDVVGDLIGISLVTSFVPSSGLWLRRGEWRDGDGAGIIVGRNEHSSGIRFERVIPLAFLAAASSYKRLFISRKKSRDREKERQIRVRQMERARVNREKDKKDQEIFDFVAGSFDSIGWFALNDWLKLIFGWKVHSSCTLPWISCILALWASASI